LPKAKNRELPRPGTRYSRVFKGRTVEMEVISTPNGVRYKIGEKEYRSPSGAAKAVTGNEVNGWYFWNI